MQVLVMDAASGTDFAVIRYWVNFDGCGFGFAPFIIVPQTPPQPTIQDIALSLNVPPFCMSEYFFTERQKKERRKRGWRSYRLPVISVPVLSVRRHLQSNLGVDNIGCRNFKKRCR